MWALTCIFSTPAVSLPRVVQRPHPGKQALIAAPLGRFCIVWLPKEGLVKNDGRRKRPLQDLAKVIGGHGDRVLFLPRRLIYWTCLLGCNVAHSQARKPESQSHGK